MSNRKPVIIGVHGLANKPPRRTLTNWWKESLVEGLENIGVEVVRDKDGKLIKPRFKFRMVYWANLLYSRSVHTKENWEFDMLYNNEPYIPAGEGELRKYQDSWRDALEARARGVIGDTVDGLKKHFGADSIADWALGKLLKDLAFYYTNKEIENPSKPPKVLPARGLLREQVARVVREEHDDDRRILLVAHSMGSIISYDALRGLGRADGEKPEVARFVTIGSPLGLPHVKYEIMEEWKERPDFPGGDPQLRTPTIVTEDWTNFADRKDPVAADVHLADDYKPNHREIQVRDDLILNDYHTVQDGERKHNHHKSYGYLRAPEMAEYVKEFLGL